MGQIFLPICPVRYAGPESFEVLSFAELAREGLPPVHGGALDQTQSFLEACRFIWPALDEIKAERNPLGIG